jgi:hypothetical protein
MALFSSDGAAKIKRLEARLASAEKALVDLHKMLVDLAGAHVSTIDDFQRVCRLVVADHNLLAQLYVYADIIDIDLGKRWCSADLLKPQRESELRAVENEIVAVITGRREGV